MRRELSVITIKELDSMMVQGPDSSYLASMCRYQCGTIWKERNFPITPTRLDIIIVRMFLYCFEKQTLDEAITEEDIIKTFKLLKLCIIEERFSHLHYFLLQQKRQIDIMISEEIENSAILSTLVSIFGELFLELGNEGIIQNYTDQALNSLRDEIKSCA